MEKKVKLEFIARVTTSDGKVIERKVEAKDGIPTLDAFDLSSRQAFLESFDAYEKAALEARNKIAEDITGEYLAAITKKNTLGRK
jgi:hypothetical protein